MRTELKIGDRVLVYSATRRSLGFGRVVFTSSQRILTLVLLDGGMIPVWVSTDRVIKSTTQELLDEYRSDRAG